MRSSVSPAIERGAMDYRRRLLSTFVRLIIMLTVLSQCNGQEDNLSASSSSNRTTITQGEEQQHYRSFHHRLEETSSSTVVQNNVKINIETSVRNNNEDKVLVHQQKGQRQKLNKHAQRLLADLVEKSADGSFGGVWPSVFNVGQKASIYANATCGLNGREDFCKMVDAHPHRSRGPQCGVCDGNSADPERTHPIWNALDGSPKWWQSPTLSQGRQFEQITVTIDLGQVYQVLYLVIKCANSPRPAAWVLERSLNGEFFAPWQYFAASAKDCQDRFDLPAAGHNGQGGKLTLESDSEVICSTKFGKALPLENGEMHVSLINGRPGANASSHELLEFTMARYVRLRFVAMHSSIAAADNSIRWLVDDEALAKRSFYSIRSIRIGGRCICSGHADKCVQEGEQDEEVAKCVCLHNTCGSSCDRCCPLFNQRPFLAGTPDATNECEQCQCHGHASECRYNAEVDRLSLSLNQRGELRGGGVCVNCTKFTTGINCEECQEGYYRPNGILPDAETPCLPCDCDVIGGRDGSCHQSGGQCECREGFQGRRCDQCKEGYEGSNCSKCPCDVRGTVLGGQCDDECACKFNVAGKFCDRCATGYFSLSANNPNGCLKCFCSGVATECKSTASLHVDYVQTLKDWRVTDIARSTFTYPTKDNETGFMVVGMFDLPEVEAIYWDAPEVYLGNRLTSYGAHLVVQISWVHIRGDTSGKPTSGPGIILIGRNGMKIATGDDVFRGRDTILDVILTEDNWYHVPSGVKDIVTRLRRTEYRGDAVTRTQFMQVLSELEGILIRGTYHTDQVESVLEEVRLFTGKVVTGGEQLQGNISVSLDNFGVHVEQCNCPLGYAGLSCEKCDFGFARVFENTSSHEVVAKCVPCNCNNHAETCDIATGECSPCLHNTFGEGCERCAIGFYGNPRYGTPNDCQPCACPMEDNNFSPSCQLKELSLDIHLDNELTIEGSAVISLNDSGSEYICTQCPEGHVGDHCERCDESGYYGSPTIVGSKCQPCECNGGPCDPVTGDCITCLGNTEGWRCERCKMGYWGDPATGCELCECYMEGSLGNICDPLNGQCECKQRYNGIRCDHCDLGYGNLTLDCPACLCNASGSTSDICNPHSGQCPCKEGVSGRQCDDCEDTYFNLTEEGCEECRCNQNGSLSAVCDKKTGQCRCKPNVLGKFCDQCASEFHSLAASCLPCNCDETGSKNAICDDQTGRCRCKPGVAGLQCNKCADDHYGFSHHGCKKCDSCPGPHYVCDQTTGRCVCPPNSHGPDCQHCVAKSYGWQPKIGCKKCECDAKGSIGACDTITGQCQCREGYVGKNCDQCASDHFGYPNCTRCNCDTKGSLAADCDYLGQCRCKELVTGLKCDQCRQATFGLAQTNPEGCTRCYCSGRSQECEQSDLSWGQVRQIGARNLTVEYVRPMRRTAQEYEYVVVEEPRQEMKRSQAMEEINSLHLIPSSSGNISIGSYVHFDYPLFFQLAPQFLGNKVSSYAGYLKFTLIAEHCNKSLERQVLERYPLVQIHAYEDIVLDYFGPEILNTENNITYCIELTEKNWRLGNIPATRGIMMTSLMNITRIFVRGTAWPDFSELVLSKVAMDTGIYLAGSKHNPAIGVEKCECPEGYSGNSCQDPANGYYRHRNQTIDNSLERYFGTAQKCSCSGRSESCDPETGYCRNCRENTGGHNCNACSEGFYGDPKYGSGCVSCPCPETRKNFARGCHVQTDMQVYCMCKPGYTGPRCEFCEVGYYGNPETESGHCDSCECNPDGITRDGCDQVTGACFCKPGVFGRRCDQCEAPRHVLKESSCQLCDNCTLTLLDKVDEVELMFHVDLNSLGNVTVTPPYETMDEFERKAIHTKKEVHKRLHDTKAVLDRYNENRMDKMTTRVRNIKTKRDKIRNKAEKRAFEAENLRNGTDILLPEVKAIDEQLTATIDELNRYGLSDHHLSLESAYKSAEEHLNDISDKANEYFNDVHVQCSQELFDEYSNITKWTKYQNKSCEEMRSDLDKLQGRILDMNSLAQQSMEKSESAGGYYVVNMATLDHLKNKYQLLESHTEEVKMYPYLQRGAAFDVLTNQVEDNLETIQKSLDTLANINKEVGHKYEENQILYGQVEEELVFPADKHATDLLGKSLEFKGLFSDTKQESENALKASSAYEDIVKIVAEAKEATEQAQNSVAKVQAQLLLDDNQTIEHFSKKSLKISKGIEDQSKELLEKQMDLKDHLEIERNHVRNIAETIHQSGMENNNLIEEMSRDPSDSALKSIRNSFDTAQKVSAEMKAVERDSADIKDATFKLKRKLTSLEPDWDSKLSFAEENVTKTVSNIRTANSILESLESISEKNNEKMKIWNETISSQLKALKDKIAQAKHIAEGIRISLQSNTNKYNCVRSYMPQTYGLSSSNKISLTIALNTPMVDSNLLFIQGEDKKFIAIEMVRRKIRMVWNLGGKTTVITHPLQIDRMDPKRDDAWYHIEANRTMSVGSLTVTQIMNHTSSGQSSAETADSGMEYTKFMVTPQNRIWLGGVPKTIRPTQLVNIEGLGVMVHQLFIDDVQYGLWHFAHSEGDCNPGMLGPQPSSSGGIASARSFNGEGYSVVKKMRAKPYRKTLFDVQMQFRSRDENALLFLSVDEKNNRSISLTLYQGRVVFRIDYGGEIKLEINSTKKYNTGEWINVAAARQFHPKGGTENGSLVVGKEIHTGSPTAPVNSDSLPNLSNVHYYLGGLPPGFKSGTSKAPGADQAFLGCMKDVTINQESYDPMDSSNFYGVEQTCREVINRIGFNGIGYAEYPSESIRKRGNFGFVFRTMQPDCVLLMAGYPETVAENFDERDLRGNYSVWLKDGRVNLYMDGGHGMVRLSSNSTVNDGEFHSVTVVRSNRKVQLRIDDQLEKMDSLPPTTMAINLPEEHGGLFLGGTPTHSIAFDSIPPFEKIGLIGTIKDVVFNNATLQLNSPVRVDGVEMGRMGPQMGSQNGLSNVLMKTEPIGGGFEPVAEGCERVGSYSYEPNAFKYGDGRNSHSLVQHRTRNLWQKNFLIEFDFRTFYPNGVLLIAPGSKEKPKHYVALVLRDGMISLTIRGRRKEEKQLPIRLNDGMWHRLTLTTVERKALLRVESGSPDSAPQVNSVQLRLPKKISASNVLLVGGIGEGNHKLPSELVSKLEGFKGCIRKFNVNNATQDLARPGKHQNVGQCFPRVEKGSYFPGDAYAIYRKRFNVDEYLEFEIEFRTSELNGILLSVSEPNGYPALSLELYMGKVVLSCDLGDGSPFHLETDMPTKFTLCDNKWHTISGLFNSKAIGLRVDQQPPINQLLDRSRHMPGKITTKSPLYIGGLPDSAPSGSLLSRENFKGCIRNVAIRNEIHDWTDMDGLYNVLLSECLTIK